MIHGNDGVHIDLQEFMDERSKPLESVPSYLFEDTNLRYVLWSDIQQTLEGIDYVQTLSKERVLFMVDSEYQVYIFRAEKTTTAFKC